MAARNVLPRNSATSRHRSRMGAVVKPDGGVRAGLEAPAVCQRG